MPGVGLRLNSPHSLSKNSLEGKGLGGEKSQLFK